MNINIFFLLRNNFMETMTETETENKREKEKKSEKIEISTRLKKIFHSDVCNFYFSIYFVRYVEYTHTHTQHVLNAHTQKFPLNVLVRTCTNQR